MGDTSAEVRCPLECTSSEGPRPGRCFPVTPGASGRMPPARGPCYSVFQVARAPASRGSGPPVRRA